MSEMATEETPMVVEVNCATGEQIMRPMTEAELAQREADRIAAEAAEAERLAAEAAKEEARLSARAKLIAQGFTDAEIDVMHPALAAPV